MLNRLKISAYRFRREIKICRMVLKDKRTPLVPKLLLFSAIGYMLMPFDLVPDFIPVIGHLDDVILVAGLIILANKMIPPHIIRKYRTRVSCPMDKTTNT